MTGNVFVFRISGAFFFGATARVSTILDRVGERPGVFILDFSAVPLIDSTAAKALHGFVHKLQRSGRRSISAARARRCSARSSPPDCASRTVTYSESVAAAQAAALAQPSVGTGAQPPHHQPVEPRREGGRIVRHLAVEDLRLLEQQRREIAHVRVVRVLLRARRAPSPARASC